LDPEASDGVIAFTTIGAEASSAGHYLGNLNSKAVLKKLGFRSSRDEYFPSLQMNIPYFLLRAKAEHN